MVENGEKTIQWRTFLQFYGPKLMLLAFCNRMRQFAEIFFICRLVILIDSLVKWHSSHGLNMFKHLKV